MDEADRRERFQLAYETNYLRILGYALRRVESPEDAADIVATTFLIAWRRLDDAPQSLEVRLWLYGVARGVVANHRRGQVRRSRLAERLREDLSKLLVEPSASALCGPIAPRGVAYLARRMSISRTT